MITRQTIRGLEIESDRLNVEQALRTLAASGILMMQVEAEQRNLMAKFEQSDIEVLSKEINEIRIKNLVLKGLHDLGNQLLKEKEVK